MSLRSNILTGLLYALTVSSLFAGNVYVTPGSSSTAVQSYSDQLISAGTLPMSGGVIQVFHTPAADQVVFVTQDSNAPVVFATLSSGKLGSATATVKLGGNVPAAAALSADGTQLFVITASTTAYLYTIDLSTHQLLSSGGALKLPSPPSDFAISMDGQWAYVLSSSGLFSVVDLAAHAVKTSIQLNTSGVGNVSVSPAGTVYVSALNFLYEFSGQPPFALSATSGFQGQPSKLYFTPNGSYAITSAVQGTNAVVWLFDLTKRAAPVGDVPGSALLTNQAALNTNPFNNSGSNADKIQVSGNNLAYLYSSQSGLLFKTALPTLAPQLVSFAAVQSNGISGFATSDELLGAKNLYLNSGGLTNLVSVASATVLTKANTPAAPLFYANAPSVAPATTLLGYGAGLTVAPATALNPYYVRALDANGRPVQGAAVQFTAITPGLKLTVSSATTNVYGYASTAATAPQANGSFVVRASAGDVSYDLMSTVTGGTSGGSGGTGGGTPSIIKYSGDGALQQLFNSVNVPPMVVQALDASGSPLAGVEVAWTATGGVTLCKPDPNPYSCITGPTIITTTGADGLAQVNWRAGGSPSGGQTTVPYKFTASSSLGNVTFNATGYPKDLNLAPTVVMTNPPQGNRTLTVNAGSKNANAILIRVVGAGSNSGQPVPNIGLSVSTPFTDPSAGPVAQCDGGTLLTGSDGTAACNLIAWGKAGQTQLVVNIGGGYVTYSVNLTVNPAQPGKPQIVSGNAQTTAPGKPFVLPLMAKLVDGQGNPLVGIAAQWSLVTPNSLQLVNVKGTSDSNGLVSTQVTANNLSGEFQVKLSAGSQSTVFALTVATAGTSLTKAAGDAQSAAVGTSFSTPLQVKLADAAGAPVPNAQVSWTVDSGLVSLSSSTSQTDDKGLAQVQVSAGEATGTATVTATIAGLTPVQFTLTVRTPGPVLDATNFQNYSTNAQELAPGLLVLLTGTGLSSGLNGVAMGDLLTAHYPTTLAGLSVQFSTPSGPVYAPISWVINSNGSESALIQVPFEVTGPTTDAIVTVGSGSTTISGLPVKTVSPGVIEDNFPGDRRAAIVIRSDGRVVTPDTPARPGETVRMYAIGLGQTTPAAITNAVGIPNQDVAATVAVGIDNAGVPVKSVRMAQNLIGIYEITFEVPASATAGPDHPLGLLVVPAGGSDSYYGNGSLLAIGK